MEHIECPECGDYLSVMGRQVGKYVTCPKCKNKTLVPDNNVSSEFVLSLFCGMILVGMIVGIFLSPPDKETYAGSMGGLIGLILGPFIIHIILKSK